MMRRFSSIWGFPESKAVQLSNDSNLLHVTEDPEGTDHTLPKKLHDVHPYVESPPPIVEVLLSSNLGYSTHEMTISQLEETYKEYTDSANKPCLSVSELRRRLNASRISGKPRDSIPSLKKWQDSLILEANQSFPLVEVKPQRVIRSTRAPSFQDAISSAANIPPAGTTIAESRLHAYTYNTQTAGSSVSAAESTSSQPTLQTSSGETSTATVTVQARAPAPKSMFLIDEDEEDDYSSYNNQPSAYGTSSSQYATHSSGGQGAGVSMGQESQISSSKPFLQKTTSLVESGGIQKAQMIPHYTEFDLPPLDCAMPIGDIPSLVSMNLNRASIQTGTHKNALRLRPTHGDRGIPDVADRSVHAENGVVLWGESKSSLKELELQLWGSSMREDPITGSPIPESEFHAKYTNLDALAKTSSVLRPLSLPPLPESIRKKLLSHPLGFSQAKQIQRRMALKRGLVPSGSAQSNTTDDSNHTGRDLSLSNWEDAMDVDSFIGIDKSKSKQRSNRLLSPGQLLPFYQPSLWNKEWKKSIVLNPSLYAAQMVDSLLNLGLFPESKVNLLRRVPRSSIDDSTSRKRGAQSGLGDMGQSQFALITSDLVAALQEEIAYGNQDYFPLRPTTATGHGLSLLARSHQVPGMPPKDGDALSLLHAASLRQLSWELHYRDLYEFTKWPTNLHRVLYPRKDPELTSEEKVLQSMGFRPFGRSSALFTAPSSIFVPLLPAMPPPSSILRSPAIKYLIDEKRRALDEMLSADKRNERSELAHILPELEAIVSMGKKILAHNIGLYREEGVRVATRIRPENLDVLLQSSTPLVQNFLSQLLQGGGPNQVDSTLSIANGPLIMIEFTDPLPMYNLLLGFSSRIVTFYRATSMNEYSALGPNARALLQSKFAQQTRQRSSDMQIEGSIVPRGRDSEAITTTQWLLQNTRCPIPPFGTIEVLRPSDPLRLIGSIEPGEHLVCLTNNLFIMPLFLKEAKETPVRTTTTDSSSGEKDVSNKKSEEGIVDLLVVLRRKKDGLFEDYPLHNLLSSTDIISKQITMTLDSDKVEQVGSLSQDGGSDKGTADDNDTSSEPTIVAFVRDVATTENSFLKASTMLQKDKVRQDASEAQHSEGESEAEDEESEDDEERVDTEEQTEGEYRGDTLQKKSSTPPALLFTSGQIQPKFSVSIPPLRIQKSKKSQSDWADKASLRNIFISYCSWSLLCLMSRSDAIARQNAIQSGKISPANAHLYAPGVVSARLAHAELGFDLDLADYASFVSSVATFDESKLLFIRKDTFKKPEDFVPGPRPDHLAIIETMKSAHLLLQKMGIKYLRDDDQLLDRSLHSIQQLFDAFVTQLKYSNSISNSDSISKVEKLMNEQLQKAPEQDSLVSEFVGQAQKPTTARVRHPVTFASLVLALDQELENSQKLLAPTSEAANVSIPSKKDSTTVDQSSTVKEVWQLNPMMIKFRRLLNVIQAIHYAVALAPWNTSINAIRHIRRDTGEQSAVLQDANGIGDPYNMGVFFSLIRDMSSRGLNTKNVSGDPTAPRSLTKRSSNVPDLRTLTNSQLTQLLQDYSVPRSDYQNLSRWEKLRLLLKIENALNAQSRGETVVGSNNSIVETALSFSGDNRISEEDRRKNRDVQAREILKRQAAEFSSCGFLRNVKSGPSLRFRKRQAKSELQKGGSHSALGRIRSTPNHGSGASFTQSNRLLTGLGKRMTLNVGDKEKERELYPMLEDTEQSTSDFPTSDPRKYDVGILQSMEVLDDNVGDGEESSSDESSVHQDSDDDMNVGFEELSDSDDEEAEQRRRELREKEAKEIEAEMLSMFGIQADSSSTDGNTPSRTFTSSLQAKQDEHKERREFEQLQKSLRQGHGVGGSTSSRGDKVSSEVASAGLPEKKDITDTPLGYMRHRFPGIPDRLFVLPGVVLPSEGSNKPKSQITGRNVQGPKVSDSESSADAASYAFAPGTGCQNPAPLSQLPPPGLLLGRFAPKFSGNTHVVQPSFSNVIPGNVLYSNIGLSQMHGGPVVNNSDGEPEGPSLEPKKTTFPQHAKSTGKVLRITRTVVDKNGHMRNIVTYSTNPYALKQFWLQKHTGIDLSTIWPLRKTANTSAHLLEQGIIKRVQIKSPLSACTDANRALFLQHAADFHRNAVTLEIEKSIIQQNPHVGVVLAVDKAIQRYREVVSPMGALAPNIGGRKTETKDIFTVSTPGIPPAAMLPVPVFSSLATEQEKILYLTQRSGGGGGVNGAGLPLAMGIVEYNKFSSVIPPQDLLLPTHSLLDGPPVINKRTTLPVLVPCSPFLPPPSLYPRIIYEHFIPRETSRSSAPKKVIIHGAEVAVCSCGIWGHSKTNCPLLVKDRFVPAVHEVDVELFAEQHRMQVLEGILEEERKWTVELLDQQKLDEVLDVPNVLPVAPRTATTSTGNRKALYRELAAAVAAIRNFVGTVEDAFMRLIRTGAYSSAWSFADPEQEPRILELDELKRVDLRTIRNRLVVERRYTTIDHLKEDLAISLEAARTLYGSKHSVPSMIRTFSQNLSNSISVTSMRQASKETQRVGGNIIQRRTTYFVSNAFTDIIAIHKPAVVEAHAATAVVSTPSTSKLSFLSRPTPPVQLPSLSHVPNVYSATQHLATAPTSLSKPAGTGMKLTLKTHSKTAQSQPGAAAPSAASGTSQGAQSSQSTQPSHKITFIQRR